MKYLKLLTVLFLSATIFIACNKDDDDDDVGTFFECKIEGDEFRVTGTNAYAFDFTLDRYGIYGSDIDEETLIYINLPQSAGEGTYQMGALGGDVNAYLVYSDTINYSTILGMDNGQVTITTYDPPLVEGFFNFTVTNFNDPGDTRVVTDGEFRVEFQ